jgi:hypothetical protein
MTTTCQICGRAIKAAKGVIAHHGYQRPHQQGWQSGSCFGARFQPYGVACDAIPLAITQAEQFVAATEQQLAKLRSDPPAKLHYAKARGSWAPANWVDLPRPEGFDPLTRPATWTPGTYAAEFFGQLSARERDVKGAREHIAFLTERLKAWKAPQAMERAS